MKVSRCEKQVVLCFGLLVCVLVPLEIVCAFLAYETIGEVISTLYFLAIGLNLLFIILALRHPSIAALGVFILALAIVPYQLYLGHRLIRVQVEAGRIVTYAYEEKLQNGQYPSTLVNYEFSDPDVAPFIQRYDVEPDGSEFMLLYRIGTETTSHSYSSDVGWGYYPD